jgi:excinuclease ABC subunit A
MSFLPDVKVPCESCRGAALQPRDAGGHAGAASSIGDVLRMEVDEAVEFFASMPAIAHPLQLLQRRGAGLPDARPAVSPTLSGGEAQRIKLVTELQPRCATTWRSRGRKRAAHAVRAGRAHRGPAHGRRRASCIRVLHRLVDGGQHAWSSSSTTWT